MQHTTSVRASAAATILLKSSGIKPGKATRSAAAQWLAIARSHHIPHPDVAAKFALAFTITSEAHGIPEAHVARIARKVETEAFSYLIPLTAGRKPIHSIDPRVAERRPITNTQRIELQPGEMTQRTFFSLRCCPRYRDVEFPDRPSATAEYLRHSAVMLRHPRAQAYFDQAAALWSVTVETRGASVFQPGEFPARGIGHQVEHDDWQLTTG